MSVPGMPPQGPVPAAQPAQPADPAKSASIMLVVAAALILIGTVSKAWFHAGMHGTEVNVGLTGAEVCFGSRCVDAPNDNLPDVVPLFMYMGLIGGIAAAAAAGLFGGMSLANKRDKIPVPSKLAHTAIAVAGVGMVGSSASSPRVARATPIRAGRSC